MNNDFGNKYEGCSIMKKAVRKVIVYSLLVGIAQFGLNVSIIEASPSSDIQEEQQNKQQLKVTPKKNIQQNKQQLKVTPEKNIHQSKQQLKVTPEKNMQQQ